MNAILKYPGGKWRIADWIISYFPEHKAKLKRKLQELEQENALLRSLIQK